MENTTKKIKKEKSAVKLVSYEIRAIIPTGMYANIQPSIIVQAKTIEEAADYVIPHINKLFEEFLDKSTRLKNEFKVVDQAPTAIYTIPAVKDKEPEVTITPVITTESVTETIDSTIPKKGEILGEVSPSFVKAKQAILSCKSIDALKMIEGQIKKSSKLMEGEKTYLMVILGGISNELNKK